MACCIAIVLMGFLFLFPAHLQAKTMYITDRIEIGLRSGTGVEFRILGRVKTGDRVEVLESDRNWSKVRTGDGTVGWINTSFLVDQIRPPLGEDSKVLEELKEAKETLSALSKEKEALLQEKTRLSKEAAEAKALVQSLQRGITPELTDLRKKHQELEREAALLRKKLAERGDGGKNRWVNQENLLWFLSGGLVLLVGLILGFFWGRGRKKTRRFY
jgi:SH3 domain protein